MDDIEGIRNILNLAREKHVRRVFYSSSSEVYGESVSFPQNENSTPLNSRLPYASVKNLGEIYLRTFHQEYGLNYTIFRFFNTYGPRQSAEFVVTKFIRQALTGKDITLHGDGLQTRSFIYISDNVRATAKALTRRASINNTINIGSPRELTIGELAQKIMALTRSKSRFIHLPQLPEGDMSRRVPDVTLMKQVLKTTPRVSLDKGLLQTINYFRRLHA